MGGRCAERSSTSTDWNPCVASAVGTNRALVEPIAHRPLADTAQEFAFAIDGNCFGGVICLAWTRKSVASLERAFWTMATSSPEGSGTAARYVGPLPAAAVCT